MKAVKITLIAVAAALLAVGVSTTSYAFHGGGVAECGGCHSMHSPASASFLLVGSDQSSTCLSCHEHAGDTGPYGYHISTAPADMPSGSAPKQRTPGGDFGWLKKSYTMTIRGTTSTEAGQTHGHNIVAADFGYVVDGTNATAPGGSFPAANLACNSCHDMHGSYRRLSTGAVVKPTIGQASAPIIGSGSYATAVEPPAAGTALGVYRLLAGSGYSNSVSGAIAFPGVPAAKAPSTYNQTEATNQVRVAYGVKTTDGHAKWGTWCGTCHGSMHSDGNNVHPVDSPLGSTIIGNYNAYVKSGDLTGTAATAFSSLNPFVTNSGDYAALAALAINNAPTSAGPTDGDQVSCLSCHRAHASGFMHALRWEPEYEFITKNGSYGGLDLTPPDATLSRGRTNAEKVASYYDRPVTGFATYQRVLCNKCHAKD